MEQKREAVPNRAWKDTKAWLLNSFVAWILAIIIPVGCGVLVSLFIPTDATPWNQAAYGAIGALIALFLFVCVAYLVQLVITPYRQRNEARAEVMQRKQEYEDLKRSTEEQKQSGFHFEFNDHSITTKDNRLLLGVNFFSTTDVIVENLQLEVDDKQFQPLDWSPFKLRHIHSKNYTFDLAKIQSVSDINYQEAKFIAVVDNVKHESRQFKIHEFFL